MTLLQIFIVGSRPPSVSPYDHSTQRSGMTVKRRSGDGSPLMFLIIWVPTYWCHGESEQRLSLCTANRPAEMEFH